MLLVTKLYVHRDSGTANNLVMLKLLSNFNV